jgi:threonine dehydratase
MTDIAMIEAAAERLRGHARKTPLLSSPFLDELAGRRVLVKAECLQHTGSFKFRGAWSAISALNETTRARGVIAFSSGNHAQGVAYAARQHGTNATIIMPADAPKMKIDNTRNYGATVVLYDRESEDREKIGTKLASEGGLTLIPPFDHRDVIAGQGTCGLEIAQQAAELGVETADVLVCCGGGGLTSGIALALAAHAPGLTTRPCEPEGFDDVARSLVSGGIERNNRTSGSICDAIITPAPGKITFPILKENCGAGLVVSDDECLHAIAAAFARLKITAEPGGAAALAAALFRKDQINGDTVIAVLTGGNIDPAMHTRALSRFGDQI